jgi:hypothetical protein
MYASSWSCLFSTQVVPALTCEPPARGEIDISFLDGRDITLARRHVGLRNPIVTNAVSNTLPEGHVYQRVAIEPAAIRLFRSRCPLVLPCFHCADTTGLVEAASVYPNRGLKVGVPEHFRQGQVVLRVLLQQGVSQDITEWMRCHSSPSVSQRQICDSLVI